tara:strand:+ start:682 stop:834 length:153 start_codon:yes stop_codon:yes gene_type:complete
MNYRPTTLFFPEDEFDPYDGLSKKTREMDEHLSRKTGISIKRIFKLRKYL